MLAGTAAVRSADCVAASRPAAEHYGPQGTDCTQRTAVSVSINILARMAPVLFCLHLVESRHGAVKGKHLFLTTEDAHILQRERTLFRSLSLMAH